MECEKLPKWEWVKLPPYFFLTDKGAKCVEDLLHNKKNGGWLKNGNQKERWNSLW